MIKSYAEWHNINEVDEFTEVNIIGKYMDKIIEAYRKNPTARPCREMDKFPNAKGFKNLADFVKSKSNGTSAEILVGVIDEWYQWPDSKSRNILVEYINNEDDLSNLAGLGLPFGKVIMQDPTLVLSLPGLVKSGTKASVGVVKKLFSWVPKLFENQRYQPINEGVPIAIGVFLLRVAAGALLSAGTKYTLYGKESLQSDVMTSWLMPYLPNIRGLVGDDPIISTYVCAYNFMMMLIFDAWNLSMGQEKYGKDDNPIISWETADNSNYIKNFYKDFYESDPDIKNNFVKFMSSLKSACMQDMKTPEKFKDCPFYYTGEKVRVNFDDNRVENINLSEWPKWVRENYTKYKLTPVGESAVEFNAQERKTPFAPLSLMGISETPKGDPMREITLQFPDGSTTKLSLLQVELFLESSQNILNRYEISSENVVQGGSSIILKEREGPSQQSPGSEQGEPSTQTDTEDGAKAGEQVAKEELPITPPQISSGSTLEQIYDNLKDEDLSSFSGMGQI